MGYYEPANRSGGHHLVTNVARTRLVLMCFCLMFFLMVFPRRSGKNTYKYGLVVGLPSKFNMQPKFGSDDFRI